MNFFLIFSILILSSCTHFNQKISKRSANRLPAQENTSNSSFNSAHIGSDIGTVRYSPLPCEKVKLLWGPGWALANGKSSKDCSGTAITDETPYLKMMSIKRVPDLRVTTTTEWKHFKPTWYGYNPEDIKGEGYWRRVGDTLEVKIRSEISKLRDWTLEVGIKLPKKFKINKNKIPGTGHSRVIVNGSRAVRITNSVKYNEASSNSGALMIDLDKDDWLWWTYVSQAQRGGGTWSRSAYKNVFQSNTADGAEIFYRVPIVMEDKYITLNPYIKVRDI